MTTYIYAKQFYFENKVKGPGYLPILDSGVFGEFQEEKPTDGSIVTAILTPILTAYIAKRVQQKEKNVA